MMSSNGLLAFVRRLPVQVSRHPVETIFLALMVASGCWYYMVNVFPKSLVNSSYSNDLARDLGLDGGRFVFDGYTMTPVLECNGVGRGHHSCSTQVASGQSIPLTSSELIHQRPPFPYLVVKQLYLVGPRMMSSDPRGALTRRSFRALFALKHQVEDDSFLRWTDQQRFSYRSLCRDDPKAISCLSYSPTMFWNNLDRFKADENPWETISAISQFPGIHELNPVSREALFGELKLDEESKEVMGASSLVLTYMVNVTSDYHVAVLDAWFSKMESLETDFLTPDTLLKKKIVREARQKKISARNPLAWLASFAHGFWTIKDLIEVRGHPLNGSLTWARTRNVLISPSYCWDTFLCILLSSYSFSICAKLGPICRLVGLIFGLSCSSFRHHDSAMWNIGIGICLGDCFPCRCTDQSYPIEVTQRKVGRSCRLILQRGDSFFGYHRWF